MCEGLHHRRRSLNNCWRGCNFLHNRRGSLEHCGRGCNDFHQLFRHLRHDGVENQLIADLRVPLDPLLRSRLLNRSRPHPRERSRLSPKGVVLLADLPLSGSRRLLPAPPCWHCGGAVQREPLRRSAAHAATCSAAVAPCGVGQTPRRARRAHHPWRPLETNAKGHPTAVSDLECSCSCGGVGCGCGCGWEWWWCGRCADDMSLSIHHRGMQRIGVPGHPGVNSRRPQHPALMAGVNPGPAHRALHQVRASFMTSGIHDGTGTRSTCTTGASITLAMKNWGISTVNETMGISLGVPTGVRRCANWGTDHPVYAQLGRFYGLKDCQDHGNLPLHQDRENLQTGTSNTVSSNWGIPMV